jgi:hypothetical protein
MTRATRILRRCTMLAALTVALAIDSKSNPQAPEIGTADTPLFKPPKPPANEPVETQRVRAQLHKAYALGQTEPLRVFVPPFPEARDQLIAIRGIDVQRARQLGWVRNDQTIAEVFEAFGDSVPVFDLVVRSLRLRRSEIEGPGRYLLDREGWADVVVSADATRDQIIEPLTRGLREQLNVSVRLTFKMEFRDVWVVRGPAKDELAMGLKWEDPPILIYGKEPPKLDQPKVTLKYRARWSDFFDFLGVYLGRQVVIQDANTLSVSMIHFAVRFDRKSDPGDENAVIRKVTEQTGVKFTRERREVRVLTVDKSE